MKTESDNNQIKMIVNGLVIDHIPNDNLLKILQILRWEKITNPVAVGFNLTSNRLGKKALIKLDNGELTEQQKANVALFAHGATYNIIKQGNVVAKEKLVPHDEVRCGMVCPNIRCVSRMYKSVFIPHIENDTVYAICKYCELQFSLNDLKEFKK